MRIALPQPSAEAAKNDAGPAEGVQCGEGLPVSPSGDQVGIDQMRGSYSDRQPHHQLLIFGIEDMQPREPRVRRRRYPEIGSHKDAVDDRTDNQGHQNGTQPATAGRPPEALPRCQQDDSQHQAVPGVGENHAEKNGERKKYGFRRVPGGICRGLVERHHPFPTAQGWRIV